LEDSKLIPDENNSIESSPEIKEKVNKEKNVEAFTEFLEKASIRDNQEEKKTNSIGDKLETKSNSLFRRILNDGFDGISSNPNYKMLALLIILLINLSLFFVIGNIGKAFLRNAGIM
tara:strand:- start:495 stop:845 length:351 start_codon:yes stop_codon:yes gene_type:complete